MIPKHDAQKQLFMFQRCLTSQKLPDTKMLHKQPVK